MCSSDLFPSHDRWSWKNKKRKKIIEIDWLATFNHSLDMKLNKVYKDIVIKTYSEEVNSKVKARGVL